nr:DUF6884 domain-containing protein [Hassalia byssoidea]
MQVNFFTTAANTRTTGSKRLGKFMKPGFYAVLGKRDYWKINDKKVGIWELTEYQPAGWLCSLAIKPEVMPQNCDIIHDCGAFGYRKQDYPTINGQYVDAQWAANRYRERSREGDTVTCPDNLLLRNIEWRRQYNLEQAQTFIKIAEEKLPGRIPLAVIHGLSLQEKVEYALKIYQLGYKNLGIGGLAVQAKEYSANLHIIKTIVQKIHSLDKTVHFHVFGLCSPQYAKAFFKIGISFDGSTHARETFSSNTLLFNNGENLLRYPAHQAPRCSCRVCALTKRFFVGSIARNHNSDRASSIIRLTHNLNSLLAIYHYIKKPETLCLVAGCGKQTNQRAAAKDLYCSQRFQACRNYAQTQVRWQILSPLHRLLEPEKVISPYDKSPYSLSPKERQMWAQQVVDKLIKITNPNIEIVFLTGKVYRQQVIPILQKHGYITRIPMEGLGIGQQIRWLLNQSLAPKQLTLKL